MNRKHSKAVTASLATATCSLLGVASISPVQAQEEPGWDFDTALLYYGEGDGRVQDLSLSGLGRRMFTDDRLLTIGLAVDTLTGATPNGALPFSGPQTFTSPSARALYVTPPEQTPLDNSFHDTRVALSANWSQPMGRLYAVKAGLSASVEYDYMHLGANVGLSRDFNKRNTTLSLGLAVAQDELSPVGGSPIPLSPMLDVGDNSNKTGKQNKNVVDMVFGVTQVVNRNLLFQFNYSYSASSGYLNDPYKFLGLVDAISGDPVPRPQTPGAEGPMYEYRFEARPDSHTKHSLYGQAKLYMSGNVLDLSYRYMRDDWEINSHTLEVRYRWPFTDSSYLEPHFRYYKQSAAEFYRISLIDGATPVPYASSDYRLGDFDAITLGLKYGWKTRSGNEMGLRLEYYRQDGTAPPDQVIGNQANFELYPDLDAIIVQYSYKFGI